MRHNNFFGRGDSFDVVNVEDSDNKHIYKFTSPDDDLVELDFPDVDSIGNYYKTTVTTPDDDCFLFFIWGKIVEFIRVGDPDIYVLHYRSTTGDSINYKQINFDGDEDDSGTMDSLGNGFYSISPAKLETSFFAIEGVGIVTLKMPYKVVNVSGNSDCTGLAADSNFIDVGYAEFGFLGERHSYFSTEDGEWINDSSANAKAADLAKAVTNKYDLVWDDRDDDKWIGNYIAYIRSYDEEAKKFILYIPSITPEDNVNNFPLVVDDENGNPQLRGLSILIKQKLETVDDSDGATIPFKGS